jgi:hypothetical protein
MKMGRVTRMVTMVIGGMCAGTILALLVGLITKVLWNALMPDIFGLPEVGYWQAVGLLVLGHLLFGGGIREHGGSSERRRRAARRRLLDEQDLETERNLVEG